MEHPQVKTYILDEEIEKEMFNTSGGYGAPSSGYDSYARGDYFDATVAELQDQINQLVASNEALTNQVYYGTSGVTSNVGSGLTSNLIAST